MTDPDCEVCGRAECERLRAELAEARADFKRLAAEYATRQPPAPEPPSGPPVWKHDRTDGIYFFEWFGRPIGYVRTYTSGACGAFYQGHHVGNFDSWQAATVGVEAAHRKAMK